MTLTDADKILILVLVASTVAMAIRYLRLPYTIALVLTGLGIGAAGLLPGVRLTPKLLFSLFLPALLFEAAFHIEFSEFRKEAVAITTLAIPGVALGIATTAFMVFMALKALAPSAGVTLGHAFLFASLICATDPIAVLALFRKLGAPRRLSLLMEGESLFNDGTAVVAFILVAALLGIGVSGHEVSAGLKAGNLGAVAGFFIKEVVGGVAVGTAVGLAISWVTTRLDDHLVEITLTTLAAYGSYLLATHLHVSGVIAVVVAGMMCGNVGARFGMSPTTKVAVHSFWEYAAFLANSCVFLLIGMRVSPGMLWRHKWAILACWVLVLVGRALVLSISLPINNRLSERIPWRWGGILWWGGLRGGLSMVLVLNVADHLGSAREVVIACTFGVVLLSLLVQGLTVEPLMRWLGVSTTRDERDSYERTRAKLRVSKAALEELARLHGERSISTECFHVLDEEYTTRLEGAEKDLTNMHLERQFLRHEETTSIRRHLLLLEKSALMDAFQAGLVNEPVLKEMIRDADLELDRIERKTFQETAGDSPAGKEQEG